MSKFKEGNLEAPTRHPLNWKDKDFYDECSKSTQENYKKYYSEEKFLEHWNRIWN